MLLYTLHRFAPRAREGGQQFLSCMDVKGYLFYTMMTLLIRSEYPFSIVLLQHQWSGFSGSYGGLSAGRRQLNAATAVCRAAEA